MTMKTLPQLDLSHYSNSLSLSQVIAYFSRLGIELKPTTIQNYVRVGVLPPVQNRRYSKQHVVYLALINHLKEFLSLEQLKQLFGLVDFGETEEALIAFYVRYQQLDADTHQQFLAFYATLTQQVEQVLGDTNPSQKELMAGLLLGTLGSALKTMV